VITGGDPEKYKDRALAAGAVNFFHKPINNDELLTVIRQALASSTGEKQPTTGPSPQPAA
jgi:FixJ family two-component response regulator